MMRALQANQIDKNNFQLVLVRFIVLWCLLSFVTDHGLELAKASRLLGFDCYGCIDIAPVIKHSTPHWKGRPRLICIKLLDVDYWSTIDSILCFNHCAISVGPCLAPLHSRNHHFNASSILHATHHRNFELYCTVIYFARLFLSSSGDSFCSSSLLVSSDEWSASIARSDSICLLASFERKWNYSRSESTIWITTTANTIIEREKGTSKTNSRIYRYRESGE